MTLLRRSTFFFLTIGLVSLYVALSLDRDWLWDFTRFHVFQTRDIERARQILAGHAIFFGPEMTGGGTLPGPAYYYLMSLALLVSPTWQSIWYFMFGLASLAGAIGFWFFWQRQSLWSALVFITAYAGGIVTFHYLALFLNYSFAFLPAVCFLIAAQTAFTAENPQHRSRAFIAACFLSGILLQFHLSFLTFMFSLFLLFFLGRKGVLKRLDAKSLIYGVMALALSLSPFVIWKIAAFFKIGLGQSPSFPGEAGGAPPAILEVLLHTFNAGYESWTRPFAIVPVGLLVLIFISLWPDRGTKSAKISANQIPFILITLLSFFPALPSIFLNLSYRYAMPFFLSSIFLYALLHERVLDSRRRLRLFNACCGISLIAWFAWVVFGNAEPISQRFFLLLPVGIGAPFCLVWVWDSRRRSLAAMLTLLLTFTMAFSFRATPYRIGFTKIFWPNPSLAQWKWIWREILSETGWTYDEAKERLFFLDQHIELDPSYGFEEAAREFKKTEPRGPLPSGYFVGFVRNDATVESILTSRPMPPEIVEALKRGQLQVSKLPPGSPPLLPYFVKSSEILPSHFHNLGEGYLRSPEEMQLAKIKPTNMIQRLSPGRYAVRWNECNEQDSWCDLGLIVDIQPSGQAQYSVRVRLIGPSISQSSPWIGPQMTAAIQKPYARVTCGSSSTQTLTLADAIGFDRDLSQDANIPLLARSRSFLAPFERTFVIPCAGELAVSELGFTGLKVDSISRVSARPGRAAQLQR